MNHFLYEQVADRLENLIRKGVLKTGDKLASVRSLSLDQGISLSTAFKAYSHLEQKGLVTARAKSGFYIRFTPRAIPSVPERPVPRLDVSETDDTVIRFSLAAPSVALLPRARLQKTLVEVLRTRPDGCLGYAPLQGDLLLRQQLALLSFNSGCSSAPEDIVTTHGCLEAVVLCLQATTQPGDTIAVETPTFYGLLRAAQGLGLRILEIPGDPTTGVDLEWLQKALDRTTVKACLFVPNFSNPLGACMPDDRKARLVDLLEKKNIPLIEDDIYGDLHFEAVRPRTCKSFDRTGNVLLCSSFSKSLAPGYRVGWCIPGRYLDKVLSLKRTHSLSSTHPTHAAIGLFLARNRFDLHMRQLRKALHTQSLAYIQAITRYFPPDTRVTQPRGGYVLWVEMHPGVQALDLFQLALEEKISISPGQWYSVDDRYAHCIRLSFGLPYTPAIDKALKTLGKLVP